MPLANSRKRPALTPDQQVAKLQKRSREISFKAKFSKITNTLRANMFLTDTVLTHLGQVLGRSLDDDAPAGSSARPTASPDKASSMQVASPAKARTSAGSGASQIADVKQQIGDSPQEACASHTSHTSERAESDSDCDGDADMAQSWCSTKLTSYSIVLLSSVLSHLEPSCLSHHALKAIVRRGQRKESQEALVRIVEFTTGLAPNWSATGAYKKNKVLYEYFTAVHLARGRRAKEMVLPVRWETFGVYSLRTSGKNIYLAQKWVGEEVEIPAKIVKMLGGGIVDIRIESNWSETQAFLSSPKGPNTHLVMLLLPNHIVNPTALDNFHQQHLKQDKQEPLGDAGDEECVGECAAVSSMVKMLEEAGLDDIKSEEEADEREAAPECDAKAEHPMPAKSELPEPAETKKEYDEYMDEPPPPKEECDE